VVLGVRIHTKMTACDFCSVVGFVEETGIKRKSCDDIDMKESFYFGDMKNEVK